MNRFNRRKPEKETAQRRVSWARKRGKEFGEENESYLRTDVHRSSGYDGRRPGQSNFDDLTRRSPQVSGTVKNVERMGKRRLAYMVRNFSDGLYILITIDGPGAAIHEVERRLRVTEPVIKFITVRMDEEQKRLDKVKKIRDSRRRGQGSHAAAAAEAAAQPRTPNLPCPKLRRRRKDSTQRTGMSAPHRRIACATRTPLKKEIYG